MDIFWKGFWGGIKNTFIALLVLSLFGGWIILIAAVGLYFYPWGIALSVILFFTGFGVISGLIEYDIKRK